MVARKRIKKKPVRSVEYVETNELFTETKKWPRFQVELGTMGPFGVELPERETYLRVHCREEIDEVHFQQIGVGKVWGWLNSSDMGEESDRWTLYFPPNFNGALGPLAGGSVFETAKLPKSWDGSLESHLIRRKGIGNLWLGVAWSKSSELTWAVNSQPCGRPSLPVLEKGELGAGRPEEIRLLGVLRKPMIGNNEKWELLAGLVDQEGYFLGWRLVSNTKAVDRLMERKSIGFRGIQDWEWFEGELRKATWGREL